MTKEELVADVNSRLWYHEIDLGDGVITPGKSCLRPVWQNLRAGREGIDYTGKLVLDLASFDGLWAFEAEKLGAKLVVATDCIGLNQLDNFLLCRQVLKSKALPFYNVSPYFLQSRLDSAIDNLKERFDIVQHLGLLYHVRDPLMTLSQSRSVIKTGGTLLLETGISMAQDGTMTFNGNSSRIYEDVTTWWAPTLQCLNEMLRLSYFQPSDKLSILPQNNSIGRVCTQATAVEKIDFVNTPDWFEDYVKMPSRNPGLFL